MSKKVTHTLMTFALTLLMALAAAAKPLLIYGGEDHSVFLGCLNGSKFDDASIWNRFGDYGSTFSDRSIWNQFGDYGGTFSDTSPWNQFANHPPVIVDQDGNFYGYFTANRFHEKRCEMESVLFLVENYKWVIENLDAVRDKM